MKAVKKPLLEWRLMRDDGSLIPTAYKSRGYARVIRNAIYGTNLRVVRVRVIPEKAKR